MPRLPIIVFYMCIWVAGFSQANLISNPSFEIRNCCPDPPTNLPCLDSWLKVSSPDYYNLCITSIWEAIFSDTIGELPRTDSGIVGYSFDAHPYREYVTIELSQYLQEEHMYCVSFWITPRNDCYWGSDHIGALLTTAPPVPNHPTFPTLIIESPQIEQTDSVITNAYGWTKVSGSFIADGSERYLTIGVFALNSEVNHAIINPQGSFHSYYLMDDVALYPCDVHTDSARAGPDIYICQGDSTLLGSHDLAEYRYYWYRDTCLLSRDPMLMVSPDTTTTYYLKVKDFKFDESLDSVTVFVVNCDTIPQACAGNDTLVCKGDSITLGCWKRSDFSFAWKSSQDSIPFSYKATPVVDPQMDTWYYLSTTDYARQTSSDSVLVEVVDCNAIVAHTARDTLICAGDSLLLGSEPAEGGRYYWYRDGVLIDTTTPLWVWPEENSTYQLEVVNPREEVMQAWRTINVESCDIPLTVPNFFSPNGDGINDVFLVENPLGAALDIRVFNRWGSEIFRGNEDNLWDGLIEGQPASQGTYYFSVTAELYPYRTTTLSGSVTLLR